jgi:hypothetical protein
MRQEQAVRRVVHRGHASQPDLHVGPCRGRRLLVPARGRITTRIELGAWSNRLAPSVKSWTSSPKGNLSVSQPLEECARRRLRWLTLFAGMPSGTQVPTTTDDD